jgi:hypothetical protein
VTVVTTCRACGAEFEPTKHDVVRGVWRTCPACRANVSTKVTTCRECGRTLRGTTRDLCLSCLGLTAL